MNHNNYEEYAKKRLDGKFGEMSSWRFVYQYLQDKKVLDIGCLDGLYLKYTTRNSEGIEQVCSLADTGVANGLKIINSNIEDAIKKKADGEFQAVLFSHVMEHVDAPVVMLREINRVLSPGGILVLGLPTERNIFRDLWRMDYYNGTHIYAFSVRNTRKLLDTTGYKIKKIYFHLPKCRRQPGRLIEGLWNLSNWPFREYFSMAYWVVATKLDVPQQLSLQAAAEFSRRY